MPLMANAKNLMPDLSTSFSPGIGYETLTSVMASTLPTVSPHGSCAASDVVCRPEAGLTLSYAKFILLFPFVP